jgi:hypothetical protein
MQPRRVRRGFRSRCASPELRQSVWPSGAPPLRSVRSVGQSLPCGGAPAPWPHVTRHGGALWHVPCCACAPSSAPLRPHGSRLRLSLRFAHIAALATARRAGDPLRCAGTPPAAAGVPGRRPPGTSKPAAKATTKTKALSWLQWSTRRAARAPGQGSGSARGQIQKQRPYDVGLNDGRR